MARRSGKDCVLITADLHLTDRALDSYRWDIFPWLRTQLECRPEIKELLILGDLTHQKDNHSAELVLRLLDELRSLAELVSIRILKGNHDYDVDADSPFFRFVDSFENIRYYAKPTRTTILGQKAYFFPHAPGISPKMRKKLKSYAGQFDYVFMHQCFDGSVASNGRLLHGMPLKLFRRLAPKIISGDIHKPQTLGNLTYVGSPYPVAFGDDFEPRVLLLEENKMRSITRVAPIKGVFTVASIEELKTIELVEGDQIRVIYQAGRIDGEEWAEFKRQAADHCERLGVSLRSLQVISDEVMAEDSGVVSASNDPKNVLEAYCSENGISDQEKEIGMSLL